jgi:hypothetical protein
MRVKHEVPVYQVVLEGGWEVGQAGVGGWEALFGRVGTGQGQDVWQGQGRG